MTIAEMTQELLTKLQTWLETGVEMIPNLVVAIGILVVGWGLSKLAGSVTAKSLAHTKVNEQVSNLLALIVRYGVFIGAAFMALGVLDLDKTVTSLLAGVGVVGLALGFAFQDIASNFMSGVMMAVRRPFAEGEIIRTNGYEGRVESVDLRATHLRQFSGELIVIPNKDVFGEPIENVSENGARRVEVSCGVGYDDDLERAREIALDVARQVSRSMTDRPIDFWYTEFGGSSINFVLRFWIDFSQTSFLEARSEAIILLKQAFDEAGINIPYPIRTLSLDSTLSKQMERGVELREVS